MKRILIFVLLKVVEITALVFAPFWLGEWMPVEWFGMSTETVVTTWTRGLLVLMMGLLLLLMGGLFCAANWSWAGDLHRKLAKKEGQ